MKLVEIVTMMDIKEQIVSRVYKIFVRKQNQEQV